MDLLTKQSINIDINEEGTYSVDFIGCRLTDAYAILKHIVDGMESGEFFDDGLDATDADGNPVGREEIVKLIQRIKEEIQSGGDSNGGSTIH